MESPEFVEPKPSEISIPVRFLSSLEPDDSSQIDVPFHSPEMPITYPVDSPHALEPQVFAASESSEFDPSELSQLPPPSGFVLSDSLIQPIGNMIGISENQYPRMNPVTRLWGPPG
jgi:hypothetical protein